MKLKKLITIVLTVALLACAFVLPANAASASLTASNITNGTATFTLTLSDPAGVGAAEATFTATGGTITGATANQAGQCAMNGGLLNVALNNAASSVSITITVQASGDSVTLSYSGLGVYNDNADPLSVSAASGSATAKAPVVTTTAAPTTTTRSTAADLKSLSVDGYKLSPSFRGTRTSYNIEVPKDFEGDLKVDAVPVDSAATVNISGNEGIKAGQKSTIRVTVKGTDGTTRTYTITVAPPAETTTAAPEEPVKLSSLKIGADCGIEFQPDVLAYTVKVPAGTKSLDVEALIGEIEGATVKVEGADDLAASNHIVKVIVTDANGNETVYTITVEEETPLAAAPVEEKGGVAIWLVIMLVLFAFILGLVIGFLIGKKKAENDYYDDDDDDDDDTFFGGSADPEPTPVSPYSGGMNFNPPSVGGSAPANDYALPYQAAAPIAPETPVASEAAPEVAPTPSPIASAASFIQSAD